jgi:hypothetical protein
VLANWQQDPQPIQYSFLFDDYGLQKGRPYRLSILHENRRRTTVGIVKDDFTRTDTLDGRSVIVYILEPTARRKPVGGIAPKKSW